MRKMMIIGANSNIGAYLARYYQRDYRLLLHYHQHKERLSDLEGLMGVQLVQFDIRNQEEIKTQLKQCFSTKKDIPDIIINTTTARSTDFKKLAESELSVYQSIADVNINGTYYLLKNIIPYLRKKERSWVVLFSSNVSRIGLANGAVYSASKAWISNLVRSVAIEEADHHIMINAVSPGPVAIDDTQFSEEYRQFRKEYYQEQLKKIPLQRFVEMGDISHCLDYLISDRNHYITGEEHFITGGSI